ncbi:SPT2-like protein [Ooceraea biroi]|uniref:Protein SPT2 homolog n=1 Tax=Ooceraea biroi TaxID=2015173 RepID=A0A026WJI8_OOCBI|nr:SPT2-like protein [Ooceraea biroi]
MDFSTLISVAKDNETSKQTAPCYRTKFAPPKKQTKQSKTLSENIKKFLARKEEEERHKALEEKKKKDDRVKQALKQQELEENNGHRRKRKSSALNAKETQVDKKPEKSIDDKVKEEDKSNKPKPERKMLPPPMEFAELLKLAEKKQHEPVIIEIKPKVDDGRPMTKRQKKEWEYLQEKEKRERERANLQKTSNTSVPKKPTKIQLNKIPKKLGNPEPNSNSTQNKNSLKDIVSVSKKVIDKPNDKHSPGKAQSIHKDDLLEERRRLEVEKRHLEEMRRAIEEEKRKLVETKSKQASTKSQPLNVIAAKSKTVDKQVSSKNTKSRLFQSEDLKPSSFLSSKKSGQSPPLNIKSVKSKQVAKKPLTFDKKRRIYDDNDDEYDSDLDDFIDDGTEEDHEDYSKHISEIFGYDKNKYQHMDDEDDTAMESNFAQQLKEEYVSTKIGIMEDLEDMRMEAIEKKRKAALLKQKK